jgi:cytidylate kinase
MAVITISRQFGAGGQTFGQRIADKLGYFFADEDAIERAAVEIHVSPDWKNIIELEPGGKFQRYIEKLNPFGESLMERPLDDKKRYIDGYRYVELLNSIITRFAEEGDAVIVGRGGQYILEDFEDAYHVFLTAEEKDRIQFMVNNYPYSYKKAAQVVKRMEKRRENLYSFFGRKDYDDLTRYHLTLNMSMLSIEKTEELVCELVSASEAE